MNENDKVLSDEAISALENGHIIQAIKITRVNTGLGLKQAKEVVEAYVECHPALKEKIFANRISFNISQERFIHILIVVGLVVAYIEFFKAS